MTASLRRLLPNKRAHAATWRPEWAALSLAAAYVGALSLTYVLVIAREFAYEGYVADGPSPWLVVGVIAAILPAALAPVSAQLPSQVIVWLVYLLAYVPAVVLPHFLLGAGGSRIAAWNCFLLGLFLLFSAASRLPAWTAMPRPRPSQRALQAAAAITTLLAYGYIVARTGLPDGVVSLAEVYDVRDDYKRAIAQDRFLPYITEWQGNVVNPIVLAIGLLQRRWAIVAAAIAGQLLLYELTGFKSVLFSVVALPALAFLLSRRPRTIAVPFVGAALAFLLLAGLLLAVGWESPVHLFVRRLLVAQGVITTYYWQFFSEFPPALLGHSVLEPFVDYPYPRAPSTLLGLVYYGTAETSANGGLWADGFANFRYLGAALMTVVAVAVLWALDQVGRAWPRLAAMVAVIPGVTLANSSLLTTLLTHGLGLALLALWLIPASSQKPTESETQRQS